MVLKTLFKVAMFCLLSSCVTTFDPAKLPPIGPERCSYLKKTIDFDDPISTLNRISMMFDNGCYEETIKFATKAREAYGEKSFSVVKESLELFIAEGTVTDYVLESYERGYLSFLITLSLIKTKQVEQMTASLNRYYKEEVALTYNFGQDPVNTLLQAALWDSFPKAGYSSRPFWLWLTKAPNVPADIKSFATQRIKDLDHKKESPKWQIKSVASFPELNWSLKFQNSTTGYFKIKPSTPFIDSCADTETVVMPTKSWFEKIAIRHSHSYHPLVNVKTWIRLPVGLLYGITTAVAGAGIVVGGCAVDAQIDSGDLLCQISIHSGSAMIAQSDDVVSGTLRPDLRHWERIPGGFIITSGKSQKKCLSSLPQEDVRLLL